MLKVFFAILVFVAGVQGRENPFFPVASSQDVPFTSNQIQQLPMLKRATVTLPSTARVLESVTVEYKNLDGSIAQKKVSINNAIDWHLPLFISQNYNISQRKEKTNTPKREQQSSYKKIAVLKFISFYANDRNLKILTKDKLLRNFLLVKPHRIVCDFQRDTDLGSFVKSAGKDSLFTKIRVGTHKGYYRVVIELDGYYTYKIDKVQNGYMIRLL